MDTTRFATNALTAHSRRSRGSLTVRLASKVELEASRHPFMAQ